MSESLQVGRWPDRKRKMLWVYDTEKNLVTFLASFVSDEAANRFVEMVKVGIVYGGATVREGAETKGWLCRT